MGDNTDERARAIAERHVRDVERSLAHWLDQRVAIASAAEPGEAGRHY